MPMLCITKVSSILLHTNQPGKEDRKDSHHKLSALLSLIFGRSSSWCSMTNNLACSLASSRSSLFHSRGHSSRNENYVLLAIRHDDPCQLATPESEETKIGHLQVCGEEVLNSVSPRLLKKPFVFCCWINKIGVNSTFIWLRPHIFPFVSAHFHIFRSLHLQVLGQTTIPQPILQAARWFFVTQVTLVYFQ